tara:strand:- start:329 stop:616 length:288 start_codon:yes stop_codon:yes gene_type:complete
MNDTLVFIYLIFFVMVFASTFAFMWRMMSSTLAEMDRKPTRSYGDAMKPYKIPAPHPEMEGVKTGEELLVYTPEEFDEDEDDDDGDIPAYRGENI